MTSRQPAMVELHLHLEGSIPLDALASLVRRKEGFGSASPEALRSRFRAHDFHSFLQAWSRIHALLRTPEDWEFAARSVALWLQEQGVVYAELHLTPPSGSVTEDLPGILEGVAQGFAQAKHLRPRILLDPGRARGARYAVQAVEACLSRCRWEGLVCGIGLGGYSPGADPVAAFAPAFALACEAGLGRTVHAGETGGTEEIRDAILRLGAQRIGHALAAANSEDTLLLLQEHGVTVECCPGSNLRLGLTTSFVEHPIHTLRNAGIPCCLSCDDPGILALDPQGERKRARSDPRIGAVGVQVMELAAAHAAFLPESDRDAIATTIQGEIYLS